MKLEAFVAATYASTDQTGKLNIMGIFSHIVAGQFPVRHPEMYLVATLLADKGECKSSHDLTITLTDEDEKEMLSWSREISATPPPGIGDARVDQILRITNLTFPGPGAYTFSLSINGTEMGSARIFLTKTQPT